MLIVGEIPLKINLSAFINGLLDKWLVVTNLFMIFLANGSCEGDDYPDTLVFRGLVRFFWVFEVILTHLSFGVIFVRSLWTSKVSLYVK